jgi:[ribosomal protein S18]-alanine N-acetyltransferase
MPREDHHGHLHYVFHGGSEGMIIRDMLAKDVSAVVKIDAGSFAYPWKASEFNKRIRQKKQSLMVAVENGIVGYMVCECSEKSVGLVRMAVAEGSRRNGIGREMIELLASGLTIHHRNKLTVSVRESNLGCQLFLKKLDFSAVRIIKGHYSDSGEDAYRMVRYFTADIEMAARI